MAAFLDNMLVILVRQSRALLCLVIAPGKGQLHQANTGTYDIMHQVQIADIELKAPGPERRAVVWPTEGQFCAKP